MAIGGTRLLVVGLLLAGALSVVLGYGLATSSAQTSDAVAKRVPLAEAKNPRGANGRTLGLSRVVIPPGVKLPLHHHEGTQIARIRQGTLHYTVESGKAKVYRGQADGSQELVRTIEAGQTRKLKKGEWIVEQPSDHHKAENRGEEKVAIYLATLLKNGAPASTPLE